jgi:hypothetical protein
MIFSPYLPLPWRALTPDLFFLESGLPFAGLIYLLKKCDNSNSSGNNWIYMKDSGEYLLAGGFFAF